VTLDPQADALCERILRSGGGAFAGRTVAEVRHAGLELAGTWSLGDDDLGVVAHLSRRGLAEVASVAAALGMTISETRARLEGLRRGGYVRMRVADGQSPRWSAVLGGHARGHSDAGGGLAALLGDLKEQSPRSDARSRRTVDIGGGVSVRIYPPVSTAPDDLPLVYFVHGGAWVSGTLDAYDNICASVAELADCVVVSLDYRLAPEHPFPAGLDDTIAGLRWIVDQATSFGADPTRIAVMGDSAGGNLATVAATIAAQEGWCHALVQVLLYPVLDVTMASPSVEEHAFAPLFSKADMEWMFDHYKAPADDWRASPVCASDLAGAPPALIITADIDPVRDDGHRYVELLRSSGVWAIGENYEGMMHGFFSFAPALDAATEARQRVASELRRVFGTDT
jgi:acetyl esterase